MRIKKPSGEIVRKLLDHIRQDVIHFCLTCPDSLGNPNILDCKGCRAFDEIILLKEIKGKEWKDIRKEENESFLSKKEKAI